MRELSRRELNDLVTSAEGREGPEAPEPSSPLFTRFTKQLPNLLPWEVEITPWAFGAVEYAERYWSQAREVRRWQIAAFLGFVTSSVLAVCLVMLARSTRVVPYVVQVDEHGYAVAIAPAEKASPVDERVVISSLSDWVRAMRTVMGDRDAQRELVDKTYSFLSEGTAAQDKANAWFRAHNPFEAGAKRVSVQVTRIGPMRSAAAWTIEWTELAREGTGTTTLSRWSAYVEIKVSPVQKLDDVKPNPLGIFVTDYSISQLQ
jgi:type IV secretory pathway TrbF-like protein